MVKKAPDVEKSAGPQIHFFFFFRMEKKLTEKELQKLVRRKLGCVFLRFLPSEDLKAGWVYLLLTEVDKIQVSLSGVARCFQGMNHRKLSRIVRALKEGRVPRRRGRPPYLGKNEKIDLSEELSNREDLNDPVPVQQIPQITLEIKKRRKMLYSEEKAKIELVHPSRTWFYKNKNLLGKQTLKPSKLDYGRGNLSKHAIQDFFTLWGNCWEKKRFLPSFIFNMDETQVFESNRGRNVKVVTRRGVKKIGKKFKLGGKHVTAVVTIAADGTHLETLLLRARKTVDLQEVKEMLEMEVAIGTTAKGWMERSMFLKWVEEIFIPSVKERRLKFGNQPAALLVDGHNSRTNLEAIKLLRENNIDLIVFPAHSSHIIQPLDNACFRSFKSTFRKIREWENDVSVFKLLKHALQIGLANLTVESSFKNTGIWPIQFEMVSEDGLLNSRPKEMDEKKPEKRKRFNINNSILTGNEMFKALTAYQETSLKKK